MRCATCGEEKLPSEMRRRRGKPSTLCRACHLAYNRRWKAANREHRREHLRAYRARKRAEAATEPPT